MKTHDEIKDDYIKNIMKNGCGRATDINNNFQVVRVCNKNKLCSNCESALMGFYLGVEEGKKRNIEFGAMEFKKVGYNKACEDIIFTLKSNPNFNQEQFIWLIRKLQEGQQ